MTVESVRCFNKGRGQFVLWAGIKDPAPLERLARTRPASFHVRARATLTRKRGV
jgi:hypothetical protein